jgi:uncharacterized protein (DUF1684 family)
MKPFVALSLVVLLAGACREEPVSTTATTPSLDAAAHQKQVEEWQEARDKRLRSEDGWLTLIGLFWLDEGDNVITLPKKNTPPIRLVRNGERVMLEPDATMTVEGKPIQGSVELRNDLDPNGPTLVQMGSVRFNVIKRADRFGLRVKDAEAETRTKFEGMDYYPIDGKWRVEATMIPYQPVKKIPITDITGTTSDSDSPGALVFTLEGKEYRLDPILEEGSDELFVIFKDETSRDETYQAGRYLYAAKPGADGRTVIDFNKAYNPPCVFTPYATCPLPPLQNRLALRIEAGEKRYAAHE